MTISEIITDESLLPLLQTSQHSLAASQRLLELHASTINEPSPSDTKENNNETSKPTANEISALQKELLARLALLRNQHRTAVLGVRATKQSTAEARQEIDRLHLQLQNLYYEQRHLMGEIEACESYEHPHTSLPLLPLETYLAENPENTSLAPSALMKARITHEHAARLALESARQDLLKQKQALIMENKKRKEDLRSLDADLERFIDAARPIRELFEREY